ncbi:type IV pilin protein [Lysinibacillus sphaericus]|uniref:type IV pilin protein n=1 Tax=Lysinibacillus sphaericus TaxID=1421 RepID=UPI003F79CA30
MFKKLINKKLVKNEKGLTLIELLAVIVILAIISAIAVPAIGSIVENSRIKAAKSDAINILNAANIYFTDDVNTANITSNSGTYTPIDFQEYIQSAGTLTSFTVTKGSPSTLTATVTLKSGTTIAFSNATLVTIDASTPKSDGTTVVVTKK